jgi:hypothetical protein
VGRSERSIFSRGNSKNHAATFSTVSAIFGHWLTLSHGHSNRGSAQTTDRRVRIMPVASSAFTDGRGSRAKANQHRDVDVRFRKGEGITVTLTGLSAGKRSGVRQYRLGRRIAASVGKQFYCAAEASVAWTLLAAPGVVCGSALPGDGHSSTSPSSRTASDKTPCSPPKQKATGRARGNSPAEKPGPPG